WRRWMVRSPETPSIITSRTSAKVSPTSAIGPAGGGSPVASARTHSAPARVLPEPRPPRRSHTSQSPSGASWSPRRRIDHSFSMYSICSGVSVGQSSERGLPACCPARNSFSQVGVVEVTIGALRLPLRTVVPAERHQCLQNLGEMAEEPRIALLDRVLRAPEALLDADDLAVDDAQQPLGDACRIVEARRELPLCPIGRRSPDQADRPLPAFVLDVRVERGRRHGEGP